MKVVLVEDSVIVRARLTLQLTRIAGVQVTGHASGEDEAVELVLRQRPDLVLMDIGLESGDGLSALLRIRATESRIRIWMLTNHVSSEDRQRGKAGGAEHFFAKNTEIEKLIAQIRAIHLVPSSMCCLPEM
ncbi:response regulator transcription factor [uncultured Oxalicibacterium sp.]|uniref:response regulator n=1 Tax=uncultured Oxalicibacterium sp. TaxID=1168540 RepID=UPI0025ECFEC9|nr:response regulator transcription factor [uncultured Oxalicibacterium sp.]